MMRKQKRKRRLVQPPDTRAGLPMPLSPELSVEDRGISTDTIVMGSSGASNRRSSASAIAGVKGLVLLLFLSDLTSAAARSGESRYYDISNRGRGPNKLGRGQPLSEHSNRLAAVAAEGGDGHSANIRRRRLQSQFQPLRTCATDDKCAACEGTCSTNRECARGLRCFKRQGDESVPGCAGSPISRANYCYDPDASDSTTKPPALVITTPITYDAFLRYQEGVTVACLDTDGVTIIQGYNDLAILRTQMESARFVIEDSIPQGDSVDFTICPGSTFRFVESAESVAAGEVAVVLPALRITSSRTTLRCGVRLIDAESDTAESLSEEQQQLPSRMCVMTDGTRHLVVGAGLENVVVRGFHFSNTRLLGNSVTVQKYPRVNGVGDDIIVIGRSLPVNFVDCTWSANQGNYVVGVERLSSTPEPTIAPTTAEPNAEPTGRPRQTPTSRPTRRPPRPEPTTAPPTLSMQPTETGFCYGDDDWEILTKAVASGPKGSTFVICPGTTFDLTTNFTIGSHPPFYIDKSGTVIKCGFNGRRSNECYIKGNTEHFIFVRRPQNVRIEGISFEQSNGVASIIAAGDERASVMFTDCAWYNNFGRAVILISNWLYEDGSAVPAETARHQLDRTFPSFRKSAAGRIRGRLLEQRNVDSMNDLRDIPPPPEGGSQTVDLENCVFRDNDVEYSVITNWGGRITMTACYFRTNRAVKTVVGNFYEGEASLSTSCFVRNSSEDYPGSVFVQTGSVILKNEANYARLNNVGDCQDIWREQTGDCRYFDQLECPLGSFSTTFAAALDQDDLLSDIEKEIEGDEEPSTSSPTPSPTNALTTSSEYPSSIPTKNLDSIGGQDSVASENPSSVPSESSSSLSTSKFGPIGGQDSVASANPSSAPSSLVSGSPSTSTTSLPTSMTSLPTASASSNATMNSTTETSIGSPTNTTTSPAPTVTSMPTPSSSSDTTEDITVAFSDQIDSLCAPEDPAFRHSMELADGLKMHYLIEDILPDDTVSLRIKVEYNGLGWVGFGRSPDGRMIGSEVVIGLPDGEDLPKMYQLNSKALAGIVEIGEEDNNLVASTVLQEDGKTVLDFTEILPITDTNNTLPVNFVWAVGSDNELAQHSQRGSFGIDLYRCFDPQAASDDSARHRLSEEREFDASQTSSRTTITPEQRSLQSIALTEDTFGERPDLSLSRCAFGNNSVTGSVVRGNEGVLGIAGSIFTDNIARSSVVEASRGMLSMSKSCFERNVHGAQGVVTVGSDAFLGLADTESNYGDDNESSGIDGEICRGIFVEEGLSCGLFPSENCADKCIPFDADTCEAPIASGDNAIGPRTCLSDDSTEGFSDITRLQEALDDDSSSSTFVLCPFTTFDFGDGATSSAIIDPLRISKSNVRLQCGSNGSSANGCIFQGGSRHLLIENGSLNVAIEGIRFVASTEVSVVIDGTESSTTASFNDCHWQGNEGTENFLVLGPGMGQGPLPGIEDDDGLFPPAPVPGGSNVEAPTPPPTRIDDDIPNDDFFNFGGGRNLQGGDICGSEICEADEFCCIALEEEYCSKLECDSPGVSVDIVNSSFLNNAASTSVVMNQGGDVQISETIFQQNNAIDNIVTVVDGMMSIENSSFKDNAQGSNNGVIFIDSESTLLGNENNYGLENNAGEGNSCTGIYVEISSTTGDCEIFDATDPPTSNTNCVAQLQDLRNTINAVRSVSGQVIIIICPDTDLVLTTSQSSESSQPLLIDTSGIKFICGEDGARANDCVFSGGYDHFIISGTEISVEFVGLTMKGSTGLASIIASADSGSEAIFTDCLWKRNTGSSVVTIHYQADRNGYSSQSTQEPDADRSIYDIPPPSEESMEVTFNHCSFEENTVDQGVIVNTRGALSVSDSYFQSNEAEASAIGTFHDGTLVLKRSCFRDNVGIVTGSVFIDAKALTTSLLDAEKNFGARNTVDRTAGICEDISVGLCDTWTQACTGTCTEFDANRCQAEEPGDSPPTIAPGPGPDGPCIPTWIELRADVAAAASSSLVDDLTFTLCPDSVYQVDSSSPLTITSSGTIIKCGASGSRTNSCTIAGGSGHFVIAGTASDVTFAGLTMIGASGGLTTAQSASILAQSGSQASATFIDCEWAANTGSAVVLVTPAQNDGFSASASPATTGERDVERQRRDRNLAIGNDLGLPASQGVAMMVSFRYCRFSDNTVRHGVVSNFGGKTNFFDTEFLGNTAQGTVITAWNNAFVSLQNTCIIGNQAGIPGTVFLQEGSVAGANSNNFGNDNVGAELSECTDIFYEGVCVNEPDPCIGFCNEFTATSCRAQEAPLNPLDSPPKPSTCYHDWEDLSRAVSSGSLPGDEYIVCPGTTLHADMFPSGTPIVIERESTTIKCGEDGRTENRCIVNGGSSHFKFIGGGELRGLTMQASSHVSVLVAGDSSNQVKFSRCRWDATRGEAAVALYNERTGEPFNSAVELASLQRPSASSASVEFEFCHFARNDNSFGEIGIIGGATTTIIASAFSGNVAKVGSVVMLGGDIGSNAAGTLDISDSCFLENEFELPGVVYMESDPNLNVLQIRSNYEASNEITSSNSCTALFIADNSAQCFENSSSCRGLCSTFTQIACSSQVNEEVFAYDPLVPPNTTITPSPPTISPPTATPGGGELPDKFERTRYGKSGVFIRNLLIGLFLLLGGIGAFIVLKKRTSNEARSDHYDSVPASRNRGGNKVPGSGVFQSLKRKRKGNPNTIADTYNDDEDDGLEDGL